MIVSIMSEMPANGRLSTIASLMFSLLTSLLTSVLTLAVTYPSAVTSLAVMINLQSAVLKMKSPRIGSELRLLMTLDRASNLLLSALLETVNLIKPL